VQRVNQTIFKGKATTTTMKRTLAELVENLPRELDFPHGVFLMTGTCLMPGNDFTLAHGDVVTIQVGALKISTPVQAKPIPCT
jgi:2-dehydro-3-deoxy-D-arabinonate dehydratase